MEIFNKMGIFRLAGRVACLLLPFLATVVEGMDDDNKGCTIMCGGLLDTHIGLVGDRKLQRVRSDGNYFRRRWTWELLPGEGEKDFGNRTEADGCFVLCVRPRADDSLLEPVPDYRPSGLQSQDDIAWLAGLIGRSNKRAVRLMSKTKTPYWNSKTGWGKGRFGDKRVNWGSGVKGRDYAADLFDQIGPNVVDSGFSRGSRRRIGRLSGGSNLPRFGPRPKTPYWNSKTGWNKGGFADKRKRTYRKNGIRGRDYAADLFDNLGPNVDSGFSRGGRRGSRLTGRDYAADLFNNLGSNVDSGFSRGGRRSFLSGRTSYPNKRGGALKNYGNTWKTKKPIFKRKRKGFPSALLWG